MNATVQPLSLGQATTLVAEREIVAKVRSKAFVISTLILVLGTLAAVIVSGFLSNRDSTPSVAAPPEAAAILSELDAVEVTEASDRADAEQLVLDEEVDAAVVVDESSPTGVTVIARSEAPTSLVAMLSQQPTIVLLDEDASSGPMRMILGMAFGLVFMMAGMSFGAPVASSVVEEKATRIVEILLSAVPARALLAGKVIANAIVAVGQVLLLAVAVVVGLVVTSQTEMLQAVTAPILWFALFFVFGFVLIASMFAAAGSMVSRSEDVGTTMSPIMWLIMLPYFAVIFLADNPLVMTILSYVPFSAPVAMPIRLFFAEAAWWEPLIALVLMVITCGIVIMLAAKIYENSLLKMGARVKLREALTAQR